MFKHQLYIQRKKTKWSYYGRTLNSKECGEVKTVTSKNTLTKRQEAAKFIVSLMKYYQVYLLAVNLKIISNFIPESTENYSRKHKTSSDLTTKHIYDFSDIKYITVLPTKKKYSIPQSQSQWKKQTSRVLFLLCKIKGSTTRPFLF